MAIIGSAVLMVRAQVVRAQTAAQTVLEARDTPAERLQIGLDRNSLIDVEWAGIPGHLQFDASAVVSYTRAPLNLYDPSGQFRRGTVVADRVGGSVALSLALFEWVQIAVDLPMTFFQNRTAVQPSIAVVPFDTLPTTGLGDVRASVKVRILQQKSSGFGVALLLAGSAPSGRSQNYFGEAGWTLSPAIAASFAQSGWRAGVNAGVTLRPARQFVDQPIENEIVARAGVGYAFSHRFGVPLELDAALSTATRLSKPFSSFNATFAEARGMVSYTLAEWCVVSLFGGAGFGHAWGTPDWRFGLVWRVGSVRAPVFALAPSPSSEPASVPVVPVVDSDGDGIPDESDRCAQQKEDIDDFEDADGCPELDNDRDGVADELDACRSQAEDRDNYEDSDGCPETDNDKDGLADALDTCPAQAGVRENDGCPDVDSDQDGIVDRLDNCPAEVGVAKRFGCREIQLVQLAVGKIDILERIHFATGSDRILPRSKMLLRNVAAVILSHPTMKVIRVEGHSDATGNSNANLKLSDRRAHSVRAALVKLGVGPERLVSKGFGEYKPVASNKSERGRARNRRVQFIVVGGMADEGESLPSSSPVTRPAQP